MQAIAYLRRSKKSDERSVSLKEQELAVRDYATLQSFTLSAVLIDDGVSGGDRERYARIFQALHETGAKVVLCYHIDRFARDVAGMLDTLEEFKKQGVELWVVGRGRIETARSDQLLMTGVEALVAEYQRKVSGEKTKAALLLLKRNDKRYSGKAPWGYRFMENELIKIPEEQEALLLIRERRDWPARRLRQWLLTQTDSVPCLGTVWNLQRREHGPI